MLEILYWALGPAALLRRAVGSKIGWRPAPARDDRSLPVAPRNVLGLSCHYHDSAAALVVDGKIEFAIQEERLSRRKNDSRFPTLAITRALEHGGLKVQDLDEIAFYENPAVKFDRIWDQIMRDWPRSRLLFTTNAPYFWHFRRPVEQQIRSNYNYIGPVTFGEHHRSHAASAFFTSPFERCLVVTLDGVGEFETTAVHVGEGNRLTKLKAIHFPHSLGLLYSVLTQYLGFEVNEGEYKIMGLAPYGKPRYLDRIVGPILKLADDGSYSLKESFFNFSDPDQHYRAQLIEHLGVPPRRRKEEVTQDQMDLAASIQTALEMAIHNMLRALIAEYGIRDFCFAGGVALNCTANAQMIRELGIRSHIHPASGDAGTALGAALDAAVRGLKETKRFAFSPYLGYQNSDAATEATFRINEIIYRRSDDAPRAIAEKLASGQVVAIMHGRDEWGPRALGGRSILADSRGGYMKDHLNAKIKFREEFRPFAPVVLEEHYEEYFETLGMSSSPHMLYTHKSLKPEATAAVTHVDQTSRVQTVSREQNAYLYDIIDEFRNITGVPVIINTSFNLKGEPIVSSPSDALKTFMASGIDCLAVENFLVEKELERTGKQVIELSSSMDHAVMQSFYVAPERSGLFPNRVFFVNGELWFETNRFGLKGSDPRPDRRQIVFWGDSVIFGVGRTWINMLDEESCSSQFQNGGIEGDDLCNIVKRMLSMQRRFKIDANVLFPGWHPSGPRGTTNTECEDNLRTAAKYASNLILCTLPTPLREKHLSEDFSRYLGDTPYGSFALWGGIPCNSENVRAIYNGVTTRNDIVRSVAKEFGLPLLDWAAIMERNTPVDFREDFYDICHPRHVVYPKIARLLKPEIECLLNGVGQ